jgi:hypothetical protein
MYQHHVVPQDSNIHLGSYVGRLGSSRAGFKRGCVSSANIKIPLLSIRVLVESPNGGNVATVLTTVIMLDDLATVTAFDSTVRFIVIPLLVYWPT